MYEIINDVITALLQKNLQRRGVDPEGVGQS